MTVAIHGERSGQRVAYVGGADFAYGERIGAALKEAGFGHERMPVLMGWAYLATDSARAERELREAVVASPENWEAHFGLGVCLRARDASAALAEFERALDLARDNVHCLVNMSACALDLKDAVLAERYARRAVEPRDARVHSVNSVSRALCAGRLHAGIPNVL